MQKIKEHIVKAVRLFPAGRLITACYFLAKNHLKKSGWRKSVVLGLPVDRESNALPWFTYSAIHFLEPRLQRHFRVFEYGSGNSTLWFALKVNSVHSVEHDSAWYSRMKGIFGGHENIAYVHRELGSGNYEAELRNYRQEFDIIVIDGRERVRCSLNAPDALKENGVIIWDNSDRVTYREGYDFLKSKGFRRLDFYGMGPLSAHSWCTSVFYKDSNCLGI